MAIHLILYNLTDETPTKEKKKKFTAPSNVSNKDFQGTVAKKLKKMKKKQKFKKKIGQRKDKQAKEGSAPPKKGNKDTTIKKGTFARNRLSKKMRLGTKKSAK